MAESEIEFIEFHSKWRSAAVVSRDVPRRRSRCDTLSSTRSGDSRTDEQFRPCRGSDRRAFNRHSMFAEYPEEIVESEIVLDIAHHLYIAAWVFDIVDYILSGIQAVVVELDGTIRVVDH